MAGSELVERVFRRNLRVKAWSDIGIRASFFWMCSDDGIVERSPRDSRFHEFVVEVEFLKVSGCNYSMQLLKSVRMQLFHAISESFSVPCSFEIVELSARQF